MKVLKTQKNTKCFISVRHIGIRRKVEINNEQEEDFVC
jgi:hypothetical protein